MSKGATFMKLFFFLVLLFTIVSGSCKEGEISSTVPPSPIPSLAAPSPSPSLIDQYVFKPYTDHVDPNPEVMSLEERKQLSPLVQELVALLDDYVYAFNNNVPQSEDGKFAAVDTVGVMYGEGVIKIKATNEVTVIGTEVEINAFVEIRHKAADVEPYWSGKQMFRFNTYSDLYLRLGYWNQQAN